MGSIILIVAVVGIVIYLRHKTAERDRNLIFEIDELDMELEVAIRSENFSALESIAQNLEEIRKSYPFMAKFGDFRTLYSQFTNSHNQLITKLDSVYREIEIRRKASNRA